MKRAIIPLLSIILGIAQIAIIANIYTIGNILLWAWDGRTFTLQRIVYASHEYRDENPRHLYLGLLDGTYGVISWVLDYNYVEVRMGHRIRLHRTFIPEDSTKFLGYTIVNAFNL